MCVIFVFFFNDTATTEIYTLSLHDALPICPARAAAPARPPVALSRPRRDRLRWSTFLDMPSLLSQRDCRQLTKSSDADRDRKSTRLNSSHANISYAVFCLKNKKYNITANTV